MRMKGWDGAGCALKPMSPCQGVQIPFSLLFLLFEKRSELQLCFGCFGYLQAQVNVLGNLPALPKPFGSRLGLVKAAGVNHLRVLRLLLFER